MRTSKNGTASMFLKFFGPLEFQMFLNHSYIYYQFPLFLTIIFDVLSEKNEGTRITYNLFKLSIGTLGEWTFTSLDAEMMSLDMFLVCS